MSWSYAHIQTTFSVTTLCVEKGMISNRKPFPNSIKPSSWVGVSVTEGGAGVIACLRGGFSLSLHQTVCHLESKMILIEQ